MAETPDIEAQDVAEVFDEDNTNLERDRVGGREDAEQFEDLVDVYDSTRAVGDADDDEAEIGEDMDDDDLVDAASEQADADLEDDDPLTRDGEQMHAQDDLDDVADVGGSDDDDVDGVDRLDPDEVELTYMGDMVDVEGAKSSAADMESDELSDADLRSLDYQKEPAR